MLINYFVHASDIVIIHTLHRGIWNDRDLMVLEKALPLLYLVAFRKLIWISKLCTDFMSIWWRFNTWRPSWIHNSYTSYRLQILLLLGIIAVSEIILRWWWLLTKFWVLFSFSTAHAISLYKHLVLERWCFNAFLHVCIWFNWGYILYRWTQHLLIIRHQIDLSSSVTCCLYQLARRYYLLLFCRVVCITKHAFHFLLLLLWHCCCMLYQLLFGHILSKVCCRLL